MRRRLLSTVALPLLALTAPLASAAAQAAWEARFAPAAACTAALARSARVDPGARTGSLVVRTVDFDGRAIEGVQLDVRVDTLERAGTADRLATTDTSGVRALVDLAPGRYFLVARRIGYRRDTATVDVRDGAADTVTMALETSDGGARNPHNCEPRGFRRPGERACVTAGEWPDYWVDYARRLVDDPALLRGVPRYRKRDVSLVTEEALCERAARAYGGPESPPRRVVVVRIGRSYMVHDPFEPLTAGEWDVTLFFDRSWRQLSGIAG